MRYTLFGDQVTGYDSDGWEVRRGTVTSRTELVDGDTVTITITADTHPVPPRKYFSDRTFSSSVGRPGLEPGIHD